MANGKRRKEKWSFRTDKSNKMSNKEELVYHSGENRQTHKTGGCGYFDAITEDDERVARHCFLFTEMHDKKK